MDFMAIRRLSCPYPIDLEGHVFFSVLGFGNKSVRMMILHI